MVTYTATILQPGVNDVGPTSKEYTEQALRELADSFDGAPVTDDIRSTDAEHVVGEAVDCTYDDGVVVTVEVDDEETIDRLESGIADLAPAVTLDPDGEDPVRATNIDVRRLFPVSETSPLVGRTERQ